MTQEFVEFEETPTPTGPGHTGDAQPTGKYILPGGETNPAVQATAPGLMNVPGYEIMGEVGRGGMGIVYKAWHKEQKRFVAIKMILGEGTRDERKLRRFMTEARALAALAHPNIIQLYEVGEAEGLPFFSLEYCAGGSLSKKIAANPMQPRVAAEIAEKLARAVALAHQQNIIHRDLKPGNVLLTSEGEPKISDFGIAKNMDRDDGNTRAGSILGTPSYMSPEQAFENSKNLTPQTDVYALGAILYEMLTGRPPFKGVTAMETIEQLRLQEVVPPRQLVGRVPEALQTICLKCLRKDKKERYANAGELAADLNRFLAGQAIVAQPPRAQPGGGAWFVPGHWTLAALALLAISYIIALVGAVKYWLL
jgi:eukaryotic-like serine/threonine-protein kinase